MVDVPAYTDNKTLPDKKVYYFNDNPVNSLPLQDEIIDFNTALFVAPEEKDNSSQMLEDTLLPALSNTQELILHIACLQQRKRQGLDNFLANDVIEECESPYAIPVVLVSKKDGTSRLCVDCRRLNAITKNVQYPLPRIDDLIPTTGKATYITTLDLTTRLYCNGTQFVTNVMQQVAHYLGFAQRLNLCSIQLPIQKRERMRTLRPSWQSWLKGITENVCPWDENTP